MDHQPTNSRITDSSIQGYLASLFNAGRVPPNENTVYGTYFPPGMRVTLQHGSSCAAPWKLNPGYATAHHWAGLNLTAMGCFDEAERELRKAQLLDPLSLMISEGSRRITITGAATRTHERI